MKGISTETKRRFSQYEIWGRNPDILFTMKQQCKQQKTLSSKYGGWQNIINKRLFLTSGFIPRKLFCSKLRKKKIDQCSTYYDRDAIIFSQAKIIHDALIMDHMNGMAGLHDKCLKKNCKLSGNSGINIYGSCKYSCLCGLIQGLRNYNKVIEYMNIHL